MRNSQNVETRRDRKALARHAGMGKVSIISVLAGALCALAVFEILVTVAGAIAVAINGGTNFSTLGDKEFKTIAVVVLVVAMFGAFMVGGYVSGRMSRRGGGTHGLLAGVVGVVLAALAGWVVIATGTDAGLSSVARHIQVADSWQHWRNFGLLAVVVVAAAMVLAGLAGGVEGERWHGKLLSRAVDPSYGPEATERADARRSITEAEVARLAAAGRVGRVTGTEKALAATAPAVTEQRRVANPNAAIAMPDRTAAANADHAVETPPSPARKEPAVTAADNPTPADARSAETGPADTGSAASTKSMERRHLLGRR